MTTTPHDQRSVFHAHGLRCTRQRDLIYAALRATRAHPTAEELFQSVRDQDAGLSLATVYNTLDALTRCGLVRRLATAGTGAARYDADLSPHVHLVHPDGRVEDLPGGVGRLLLDRLRPEDVRAIEAAMGVPIDHLSLQVFARAEAVGEALCDQGGRGEMPAEGQGA